VGGSEAGPKAPSAPYASSVSPNLPFDAVKKEDAHHGERNVALIFDQEDVIKMIGFHVGSRFFGAQILTVREILRSPVIEAAQGAPSFVKGITRLRGAILPIVDLGRLIGQGGTAVNREKTWVIVASAGGRNVGYIVDSVTPIIRIKTSAILPAPEIILAGLRSKYIQGVCETDKGILFIANLDCMLVEDEVNAIGKMAVK
jgi:purine-binding chemotaxis protein CheW